jgi:hypothetical protein
VRERSSLECEVGDLELEYEKTKPPARPASSLPPVCAQPSPWPDRDCDKSTPSAYTEGRRVARLREVIAEGIVTTSPHHASSKGGSSLFAGSWDWHSAVHAHWALLCIARVRNDKVLEAWLDKRLTDKALRAERDYLKKNAGFELPYGRAWLLMVLFELRRRSRKSAEITKLTEETQESVVGWLERSSFPELTGAPRFVATHESWLFAYLLVALSEPQSTAILDRVRAQRKKKIEQVRAQIAAVRHSKTDFLHLPAVLAAIDRVDPTTPAKPASYPLDPSPALDDPPLDDTNAHSAGGALVRIWPYAIDGHRGDKKACSRLHARLTEMFSRTDYWADSFDHVSHWVPQFMWMATWLAAGRP